MSKWLQFQVSCNHAKSLSNAAAFAIPAKNIGRFGAKPVGAVVEPGTQAVSLCDRRRAPARVSFSLLGGSLFNPEAGCRGTRE
jgi:hypothetical protein